MSRCLFRAGLVGVEILLSRCGSIVHRYYTSTVAPLCSPILPWTTGFATPRYVDTYLSVLSHSLPAMYVGKPSFEILLACSILLSPAITPNAPPSLASRRRRRAFMRFWLPSVRWSGFGGGETPGSATPGSGVKRRRQPDEAEDGGGGGGWGDVLLMSQRPASPVSRR